MRVLQTPEDSDWWKGRREVTGEVGVFPKAYVVEEESLPIPVTAVAGNVIANVLFDFQPCEEGELELFAGDQVKLVLVRNC